MNEKPFNNRAFEIIFFGSTCCVLSSLRFICVNTIVNIRTYNSPNNAEVKGNEYTYKGSDAVKYVCLHCEKSFYAKRGEKCS